MSAQAKTGSQKVRKLFGIVLFVIFMFSAVQYTYGALLTCQQTGHSGDCYYYQCNNGWGGSISFTCCGANICADY